MVGTAIEAADQLAGAGISCGVLNMATLKPLDEDSVLKAAKDTGGIVTAEEHYIAGGLGSMVSSILSRKLPVPVESVALDGYAESGNPNELLSKYGLSAKEIVRATRKVISRKFS